MKVDIEERHFTCIESLARIPPKRRPKYISWEMHEFARGLQYPMLDAKFIFESYNLGYRSMKVVSNVFTEGNATRYALLHDRPLQHHG